MEGKELVHLPALQVHGEPADEELLLALLFREDTLHGDQAGKLHHAVAVDVLGVDVIVPQGLDAGVRLPGIGNIGKAVVSPGKYVGYDGAVIHRAGDEHRGRSAQQPSHRDPPDVGRVLRHVDLHRTFNIAVLHPVQHRRACPGFRFTGKNDHQLAASVVIQVAGNKFGVAHHHQLLGAAAGKGVHRHTAQHLIAELPPDHQLVAGGVVHLHVFHLLKGGAIALDDLHQAARAVLLLPENQHLQRVGRVSLGKDDIFLHAVAVQICHLHRLLVFSGDRRGIAQAVHGGIDGGLQAVILLRALWQRIHLIHRLQSAAGQQKRREDKQRKQPYSLFHGISSS